MINTMRRWNQYLNHQIGFLIFNFWYIQILSAYFVVLPLRDEGAISLGLGNLPSLFVGSLLLTLVAAPVSTLMFSLPNLSKSKVMNNWLIPSFIYVFFIEMENIVNTNMRHI